MPADSPTPRSIFDWRLRNRTLTLGPRTLIMAILNLTPDSFSDGSQFKSPDEAVSRALRLLDEGADILDLGGESTRPNATPITPEQEQSRVIPILAAILEKGGRKGFDPILSIDTFHATTARLAVEAGAEIVNDVSGHTWDAAMSAACAELKCGAILMHTRGTPQTWSTLPPLAPSEVLPLVLEGLTKSIALATAAGLPRNYIVLDPGFGFGKLGSENFTLLAHLAELHALRLPILAGISRKGFLPRNFPAQHPAAMGEPPRPLAPTIAANTAAILAGAHILRVHEVTPAREAAAVADAILKAT
jgi:dihydropteroate synthase